MVITFKQHLSNTGKSQFKHCEGVNVNLSVNINQKTQGGVLRGG